MPSNGFDQMTAQVIDLKNCGLTNVSPNSFSSMITKLRKIFLNGNSIRRFDPGMLAIFAVLEKLRLQDNPLICDCESRWLKEFYDQNADKVRDQQQGNTEEPRCGAPLPVAGEFFHRLSASDFLCEKPTLDAQVSFANNRGVLTCTSQGHPTPQISWQRPNGVRQLFTAAPDSDTTVGSLEVSASDTDVQGVYKCTTKNEAGNITFSVDLLWPFQSASTPCQSIAASTTVADEAEVAETVSEPTSYEEKEGDLFKVKYFTLVDLISAILGTFVGTLIVCIIILHFCVYKRKRGSSSQYSTPPMSDYSASSVKNGVLPPQMQQHCVPIHNVNPHIQARPLPKPQGQIHNYDENHYMSTPLDDRDDLFNFVGQHNHALVQAQMSAPPCEACMTMNSRQPPCS